MNKNKIYLGTSLIIIIGVFYTSLSKKETSIEQEQSEKFHEKSATSKYENQRQPTSNGPASATMKSIALSFKDLESQLRDYDYEDIYYKNNSYLKELSYDSSVRDSHKRILNICDQCPNKEDLAVWISIGHVMDSSSSYGDILKYSMDKINSDSLGNFLALEKVIQTLTPEDSFIRGQIINTINQINVSSAEKNTFFGEEAKREVILDSMGRFSPDSLNITTAIIMLKQNGASIRQVQELLSVSLQNNKNENIQQRLLARFYAYFPELADSHL